MSTIQDLFNMRTRDVLKYSMSSNPTILADSEIKKIELNGLNSNLGDTAKIYTSGTNTEVKLTGNTVLNFDNSDTLMLPPNEEVFVKTVAKENGITTVTTSLTYEEYLMITNGIQTVYDNLKTYLDSQSDYQPN